MPIYDFCYNTYRRVASYFTSFTPVSGNMAIEEDQDGQDNAIKRHRIRILARVKLSKLVGRSRGRIARAKLLKFTEIVRLVWNRRRRKRLSREREL
jgi:hypothetical protein